MAEIRDIPGPSKRKASEENLSDAFCQFSPFKKLRPDDDPTPPGGAPRENRRGPKPRFSNLLIAPEEGHNVPRTLNQEDAHPSFPYLRLDDTFEACVILDCPRLIDFLMVFPVFDVQNRHYNMQLLPTVTEPIMFIFDREWPVFVADHNLVAGDQISFDKNLDTTISDEFYYILRFYKKPSEAETSKKPGDDADSSKKLGDGAESSKKTGDDAESGIKPADSAVCGIKPGDGAESSKTPGDDAESDIKPGDGAESSIKPGDGADNSKKSGDDTESSKKPSDDSESSKKPGDDTESSKKPSDVAECSRCAPGIEMPAFKVIYHRILLESTPPDQEQRNEPSPGSRPFLLEAICLSKTLTAAELRYRLYFDVYDAIVLADNPRIAGISPGDISMEFMVFDVDNRRYDMTLIHHVHRGGIIGFCLDGWDRVVRNQNLREGDLVAFYKFLDRRISNGYYYVVLKLPADVDRRNMIRPFKPGSRQLNPENHCFSKILLQNEVCSGNAGLRLEAFQASYFESNSRSLNELFVVYDQYDIRFDMKLSYFFTRGRGLICFLDAGWQPFVETYNLKAGDTVHVYKIFDQRVCDDHYFVITYRKR